MSSVSDTKGAFMASLDDIREKAEAAIDQAKPFVEGAMSAGAEFAERADEWARGEHPHAEGAFETVSGAAAGAVDAMANGANAAFEFIKDRVEEASGKDVDGDGQVGRYRAEDVEAGKELFAEAVADKVNKAVAEASSMTPEDLQAGAQLAAEAVSNKVDEVAGAVASVTPEDLQAGVELAAEAAGNAAQNLAAGAELAAEAIEDAINKAVE